ncbi:SDR family oxidoreductase [Flavilitoribacter nigricans]|uniref:NAD(P)-dependent oxidoreductase n=1 Tax=Flavilitoribacter nigricans (strain ATCC 23147 / DSM 23189 / NBRC 102662 / NCIMB 1420 / SS-2) TaxID=1122177 RepID=A0A2D0NAK7_FLAN2|nr:SDR family oxidoreductase [Flavilitoribacter nigricans]PHN05416.1 NAD(P)-dependent oxidoreductase [Flavilitoribacter nigricans DSM 23189 = NBRC 102662]
MILVTGATGNFGSAAIDHLLDKGVAPETISALVRDTAKAESLKEKGIHIKVGNYDDPASLVAAMEGMEKLLLVSGSDVGNRLDQHKRAIDAAKAAGVKHVVYTSFTRKNETDSNPLGILGASHIETDRYLQASGLNYTIMLNSLYADVLPMFLGEQVLENGVFYPAGDGQVAFVTRDDMAEAAAAVLTTAGHENKAYKIVHTENYTFQDVADYLSEITGKTVPYLKPDIEVYREALTNAGVPAEYIGMFVAFGEAIQQGEFASNGSDLESLLGRKPTDLKTYLQTVYG